MPNDLISNGIYEILSSHTYKYLTIKTSPFRVGENKWDVEQHASMECVKVAYSFTLADAKKKKYEAWDYFTLETQEITIPNDANFNIPLTLSKELTNKKKQDKIDTSVVDTIWDVDRYV